jgi:hypothetical protein
MLMAHLVIIGLLGGAVGLFLYAGYCAKRDAEETEYYYEIAPYNNKKDLPIQEEDDDDDPNGYWGVQFHQGRYRRELIKEEIKKEIQQKNENTRWENDKTEEDDL